jgi:hypothetical protein
MSYVGNQAHAQLCNGVGPYCGKIPQPLGFTQHNKIHKWMINSKKNTDKTPKFHSIQTTPDEKVGLATTMKKKS